MCANRQILPISSNFADFQAEGAVISVSAPILNLLTNPNTNNMSGPLNSAAPGAPVDSFAGVAGVDVPLERLRSLTAPNEQMYAFLVDNNGIVFYHPKLELPAREVYCVRRTACHIINVHSHKGTRVQYGAADERVKKLMGLIDSVFNLDIVSRFSVAAQLLGIVSGPRKS